MPLLTRSSSWRLRSAATAALVLIGFSAVVGQIVLMRELIVVSGGNEISLGIMLATWLLWTAAGSSLASRSVAGAINSRRAVAVVECLLGVSLLPTIWAVRASRTLFQTVPGEMVGPVPMLLTSLICLSGFCVLSGCLFVLATRMYGCESDVSGRAASSSAYLLESAGSAAGGILASFALLRFLGSFQIAAVVALVNLGMAARLMVGNRRAQPVAVAAVGVVLGVPLLLYVAPSLRDSSQARVWRGFQVVDSRDSIYGNLAVIQTGNLRSVYDNGVILATAPDEAAAEEAVHYALLEHPAPKRILLIGGGINGSIAQALRHPTVERVDYVELDPLLIDVAREFFPAEAGPSPGDSRVHVHHTDGRYYLRTSRESFDVLILDLPGPQTAQLNRFYTEDFFRLARDHLAFGGLVALALRSSEDYISPDLAEFLRCIHHTLRQIFPYVVMIPGEPIHFFAAHEPDVLTDDSETLIGRLRARRIRTRYVREYFIPFRMTSDRMTQVRRLAQPPPRTPVNRDFEPIAYYFDVLLWSAQFKLGYSRWFRAAAHVNFGPMVDGLLITLLGVALLVAWRTTGERRARASAAASVAAMGFTLMALQIFLLLAFQAIYGYVYHQLAILIAMFMAGIAFGSWLGMRGIRSDENPPFRTMAITQFLLALSGPALIFLLSQLAEPSTRSATLLVAQLVFPALAALCGLLGGYQFPVATEIYLRNRRTQLGLGVLYAVDLLGGCAGALVLSTYLIPVFGFSKTAWLSAAVNLAPALLAVRLSLESKASRASGTAAASRRTPPP